MVSITEEAITFFHYYFPSGRTKTVRLDGIDHVVVKVPTLWSGKWRLHGTGGIRSWYPMDMERPGRDRIFMAHLKNQWVRIGFTAVDGERVEGLFRDRGLIA